MRTSSQLRQVDNCEFNPRAKVTSHNQEIRDVRIQKRLLTRAIQGEPIFDYKIELADMFDRVDAKFENEVQRNEKLSLLAARIEKMAYWENTDPTRQHKLFKGEYNNGQPLIVDYFGEEVEVTPDYIVETPDSIIMVKVKTGSYEANVHHNCYSQEGYCFGLAGEQLAAGTNKNVLIQYAYLGSAQGNESMGFMKGPDGDYLVGFDSMDRGYEHLITEEFNQRLKDVAIAEHRNLTETVTPCTPDQCASCSHNNICHFEEPPIPAPPSETVRDINVTPSYEQSQVIEFEEGTARVNAGPGSGKTFVVGCRIASLVEKGYDSNRMCVLTFTNAGAAEMTERAMRIAAKKGVPLDPDHITSKTINAFCQDIVNDNYERLGYTRKPMVIKPSDKRAIINRLLDQFPKLPCWIYPANNNNTKTYHKDQSKIAYIRMESEFEAIKSNGFTRDDYPSDWNDIYAPQHLDMLFIMYEEFQRQLLQKNRLEFSDQLRLVNELYEQNPNLFNELGYEHIIVDEFQDTDLAQIELLKKMCDTTSFKSLMCVGDDSQSIFRFRHTSPEFMIHFSQYFGQFSDFSLLENHRSHKHTIDVANKIINKCEDKVDKDLIPLKQEGQKPVAQGFYSQTKQFDWIARQVANRWNAGKQDIAVIMSDSFQINAFADILNRYGIPSTIKSPVPVMSNSRVKALLTFYDAFMGRGTQGFLDYKNAATHGSLRGKSGAELNVITEEFSQDIKTCQKNVATFLEFAKALDSDEIDECYQDFMEGFKESTSMNELRDFMEDFKMYGAEAKFKREGKYDGVCLTTVHSSKGLEWDTTFLCVDKLDSVSYHNMPTKYRQNGEYDEQLRKMFVGCTRAREELIITGNYILRLDERKNYRIDNDFLHLAYEFCDKAWDFEYTEYRRVIEEEKQAKLEGRSLVRNENTMTFGGGNIQDVIARHVHSTPSQPVQEQEQDGVEIA